MNAMEIQSRLLIRYAMERKTTDIHLTLEDGLSLILRTPDGLHSVCQDLFSRELFEYLRFMSGMDLCRPQTPQSGEFSIQLADERIDCRFSVMPHDQSLSGVIRLLPASRHYLLSQLCTSRKAISMLESLCHHRHGLIIACGPTGSGKSTATHALLRQLFSDRPQKIVTLEDPVEIVEENMLQIEVNEAAGITYDRSITELLRHDLDTLFLGECRDEYTARMALRAALTGHLVFTTLHSASAQECLWRLQDLGIDIRSLQSVLQGIIVCSLVPSDRGREGLYEIWNRNSLEVLFELPHDAAPSLSFAQCQEDTAKCRADSSGT